MGRVAKQFLRVAEESDGYDFFEGLLSEMEEGIESYSTEDTIVAAKVRALATALVETLYDISRGEARNFKRPTKIVLDPVYP